MAGQAIRIETHAGRRLTANEIFEITRRRENALSRLLVTYIATGLGFMLLPGTFLGVWNLLSISSHRTATSVSTGWVQAHGHAQIFGWVGTFILGIGFYSIPKLRRIDSFALWTAWICWGLWTLGVSLHWLSGVRQWHWRLLLPLSSALELAAFLIFLRLVSGHRPEGARDPKLEGWVLIVIAALLGFLASLLGNFCAAVVVAVRGFSPNIPQSLDQRLLVLETWGFLVPFVWGFSAKWLPVFLGLQPPRRRALLLSLCVNSAGVIASLAGFRLAAALLLSGILAAVWALRLLEANERPAKVNGIHSTFPVFVRLAYAWAIVAAALAIWGSFLEEAQGIWGGSRHALTVGFLATMVFCIGQRVLPAFSGMRLLLSPKLMFLSLLLLTLGCGLRVNSEILAYQGFAPWAWSWLPASAIMEMTAVTLFALNLLLTFASRPPSQIGSSN
jgi:hypothetical protein